MTEIIVPIIILFIFIEIYYGLTDKFINYKTDKFNHLLLFQALNMKYKNNKQKKWGSFLAFLALAWPAFHLFRSTYTPTQGILAALFSFLAVRLWYFVYFKNKS